LDEDLETAEDGTLKVVRRTTSDRLISFTDPEAQHFRNSKVCQAFKLHVLGDTECHPTTRGVGIARSRSARPRPRHVLVLVLVLVHDE